MISEQEEIFDYKKEKLLNATLFYNDEMDEKLIEDVKNSKIAIYTSFIGNYDNLKDPEFIDDNCDYICFTDNTSVKSEIWKIIPIETSNLDNNRIAKQFKVLPHKYLKEYKYSFWIDGSFRITGSIREYVCKYLKNPILNVVHDERDCIYEETNFSSSMARYPTAILTKQIEYYKSKKFPAHYGLISGGFIFRQHNNPKVIQLMEDWWEEILKYTNQDQISYVYVCWKNNFHPSVSDVFTWNNKYWNKGEGYQHNTIINDYLTSYNVINNIESKNISLLNLSQSEIQLIYNDLINLIYEKENPIDYYNSQLFIHINNKRYTLVQSYKIQDENTLKFNLKPFKKIKKLELKPAPSNIKFEIVSINSDSKDFKIKIYHSLNPNSEKTLLFGIYSPTITFEGDLSEISYLEIKFKVKYLSNKELNNIIKELYQKEKKKNREIKKLKKENIKIQNSKSWKITKPMRLLNKLLR